jgi:radical SAM superfamily enzyme
MRQKLIDIGKALKIVAKEKANRRDFVRACKKVKRTHAKVNNLRLKILKACLHEMDAIGIPVTTEDKKLMARTIELYDKTLQELKDDANQLRGYIEIEVPT